MGVSTGEWNGVNKSCSVVDFHLGNCAARRSGESEGFLSTLVACNRGAWADKASCVFRAWGWGDSEFWNTFARLIESDITISVDIMDEGIWVVNSLGEDSCGNAVDILGDLSKVAVLIGLEGELECGATKNS